MEWVGVVATLAPFVIVATILLNVLPSARDMRDIDAPNSSQETHPMFSVFAKANQGLNLSPAARALLKLVEGFVIAALVAALPVFANLMAQQNVNWLDALRTAGATFAVALIMAVWKYLKAQGDSPLLDAAAPTIQDVINKIDAWGGIPNDVKTEVVPSIHDAETDPNAPATAAAA